MSTREPEETICQVAISRDSAGYFGARVLVFSNGMDAREIPVEFATIDALTHRISHEIRDVFEQRKQEKEQRDASLGSVT